MATKNKGEIRRQGTKTSSFGVSKRESHDSSRFYAQKIYEGIPRETKVPYIENKVPSDIIDEIHCRDSRDMSILPDNCIHLVITSPPYTAAKEYDAALTLTEYRQLLRDVFKEAYRILVPGGRCAINITDIGRKPQIPLHAYVTQDMIDIGYLMRGTIIWYKGGGAGVSTAFGSWQSARNPVCRDIHEYILIFSKQMFGWPDRGGKDTISNEDFLRDTKSIWRIPPESAKRVGHPAPFHIDLPYRLIQLYTFEGDIVLDPFIGSGTTAIAAIKSRRHFVGFDNKKEYVELAKMRVAEVLAHIPARPGD